MCDIPTSATAPTSVSVVRIIVTAAIIGCGSASGASSMMPFAVPPLEDRLPGYRCAAGHSSAAPAEAGHFVMPSGPVTLAAVSDVFSSSMPPNFSFDSCADTGQRP